MSRKNKKKKLLIRKAAGEQEFFSLNKLKKSLRNTGASNAQVNQISEKILKDFKSGMSTSEVYRMAFGMLKGYGKEYAARYNLKKSIMALGPSGFSFEAYLAALLRENGYKAYTNQIFKGDCLTHEIDVVAEIPEKNIHAIIEAKFHARHGRKTTSKDALYTYARFLDIQKSWNTKVRQGAKPKDARLQTWLVTNTKVTKEVKKYGLCVGMKIISWGYPKDNNLQALIENKGLYPVTALVTLTNSQKDFLINQGIVLCKDILNNKQVLKKGKINFNVLEEVESLIKV